jgi:hypothetical protein
VKDSRLRHVAGIEVGPIGISFTYISQAVRFRNSTQWWSRTLIYKHRTGGSKLVNQTVGLVCRSGGMFEADIFETNTTTFADFD